MLELGVDVLHRIEHRQHVGALLGRAVELAVGVYGGISLVGGDLVVQVRARLAPVPERDDDAALRALRPRRALVRNVAGGDAIGPVAELAQHALGIGAPEHVHHRVHRLPRGNAASPRLLRRLELAEGMRDGARRGIAERMAADAAVRLQRIEPLHLVRRLAKREFVLRRHAEHGVPVGRGVILRGRAFVRRDARLQAKERSGLRLHLLGINQAVAAYPDSVVRFRQLGDEEAAAIVGDDDLGEFGRQVLGLGDHPDAGLRGLAVGDDAADAGLRARRAGEER